MSKITFEHLENALDSIKRIHPELNELFLQMADRRCGKRCAIFTTGYYLKTDFMLYPEMQQFLRGYLFGLENKLK